MPTLMIMRTKVPGDIDELTQKFQQDTEIVGLRDAAGRVPEGVRRHRTYVTPDGEVFVVDEWDSAEQFQKWISQPEIQELFQRFGLQGQPDVIFAEQIELGDEIG